MASILDRLLGRPEPVEAKAVTGPGAFAMTYHTPWHSLSRDPNKLMAEGQSLFHSNGWVAAAERALGGRFIRMPWHLEDENGDTIDDTAGPEFQAIQKLLERPSQRGYRSGLWGITFRHLGLSGNAFWYLDQRDLTAGTPLQLLYINPARMTPVTDSGGNVTGWVLDHPDNQAVNQRTSEARNGVPLTTDEVIHFTLDEADWGIWGVGIPEASQRKIELDRLTENHAAGVLGAGGRLSGLVSPKTGSSLNGDEWTQFVRDWRAITSDPDAAKRLQISKQPIDFIQTTASPKDLQLIDVSRQGRDDILAQWGVPVSQIGVNVPDDGDRATADKETIWESIKLRSEGFREKVQFELLDRFAALGVPVQLVLEYPDFDDKTPQFDLLAKSIYGPLTNNERRALGGLDPLEDEELGEQIWIASSLTRIDEEPEPVVPLTPPSGATPPTDEEEVVEDVVEKASLSARLTGLRARMAGEWEPRLQALMAEVLGEQRRYVDSKLDHAIRKNDATWWSVAREDKRVMSALEPLVLQLATDVANRTATSIGRPGKPKADDFLDRVLGFIRSQVGKRVTGINETTRDKIQRSVAEAVDKGLSPVQLGEIIEGTGAFNEARAETIARTETALVYNDAALRSYGELDVKEVQAIDGDDDPECAERDGNTYALDDALGITDHPNGTLDWLPVVN